MEKGQGKNHQSRLFVLVILCAFFWLMLLYFHFFVLGGKSIDDSHEFDSVSLNIDSSSTRKLDIQSPPVDVHLGEVKKNQNGINVDDLQKFNSSSRSQRVGVHRENVKKYQIGKNVDEQNVVKFDPPSTPNNRPVIRSRQPWIDVHDKEVKNDQNGKHFGDSKQSNSVSSNIESSYTQKLGSPSILVGRSVTSNPPPQVVRHKHVKKDQNDRYVDDVRQFNSVSSSTESGNTPKFDPQLIPVRRTVLPPRIDEIGKIDKRGDISSNAQQPPPPIRHPDGRSTKRRSKDHKHKVDKYPFMRALRTAENKSDTCGGRYIYVHDIPSRFKDDMLKECRTLSVWTNMCKFITNSGLGPPLENAEGVFSDTGWYATNQFAVDVIFNSRMEQYECLTNDSSLAAAIFVPFYAGFDIARYLWGFNISTRDAASLELVDWLMKRPEWGIMGGKDHFFVAGRITWDFRRVNDNEAEWGNKLLLLPAVRNMSVLVVESSPWHGNDYGIPYPTYFHPAKDADVIAWQDRMRKLQRKWLFCFAGAPRPGDPKSIRGDLIDECKKSKLCKLLECGLGESKCHSPGSVMQMFQSSLFCLQPPGDSYTRRSAFDAMLAGCIPVFFHPNSAYTQYTWHLPKNYSSYSVLIPEDDIHNRHVSIEKILSRISPEKVKQMREEVVKLIPRIIYADPRSKLETVKDAFDIATQAIINKVTKMRRDIVEGRTDNNYNEQLTWKYELLDGKQFGPHEWDSFFSNQKPGRR